MKDYTVGRIVSFVIDIEFRLNQVSRNVFYGITAFEGIPITAFIVGKAGNKLSKGLAVMKGLHLYLSGVAGRPKAGTFTYKALSFPIIAVAEMIFLRAAVVLAIDMIDS